MKARGRMRSTVPTPEPVGEGVMFRDADYGALVVETAPRGLVVYDFGFAKPEADAANTVLRRYAVAEQREDSTHWKMDRDAHALSVLATLKQEMRLRGYVAGDKLAERAMFSVRAGEVRRPDLPADGKIIVHDAVEAGVRQHLGLAVAALHEHGKASAPSVRYYPRPNAENLGAIRPPFAVARFFVETLSPAVKLRESVLKAMGEWAPYLVKLSVVAEAAGRQAVEMGFTLPATLCESFLDAAIPTFAHSNIIGAREVEMMLRNPLTEEERRDVEALGRACTGCIRITQEDHRLVLLVPSNIPGHYGADHALHERLAWLNRTLDPWGPSVSDIGQLQEVDLTPAADPKGLAECDDDMPADDAGAMVSGDVVATLARRFAAMPPAWWSTPQGEDALRKAKALIKDEHGEDAADRFDKQLELLKLTSSPTMKAEGADLGRTMLKAAGTFVPAAGAKLDGSDDEEEKGVSEDPPKGDGEDGPVEDEDGDGEDDEKEATEESVRPFVLVTERVGLGDLTHALHAAPVKPRETRRGAKGETALYFESEREANAFMAALSKMGFKYGDDFEYDKRPCGMEFVVSMGEDYAGYLGEPGRGSNKSQYMLTARGTNQHLVTSKARLNLHRMHPATSVTLEVEPGPLPVRVDGTRSALTKATGGKVVDTEDNRFGGVESVQRKRKGRG